MSETPDVSVTRSAGRRLVRAARWRLKRVRAAAAVRLAPDSFLPQMAAARIPVDAEVAVYYADSPDRVYQLDQWLPVFERFARTHQVVVILRDIRTMKELQDRTTLPVVCVTTFLDLMNLYDAGEFKVGIYVNNGQRNFQSLNNPRMLHVHVNHGESDKLSSFSNQVKAYDRVFVAGPVAVERYKEALIDFDGGKVVAVGRPQLDLDFTPELAESSRRTVMYGPTWEGESESNNWTSLDLFGVQIVTALLALPDVRVVYKPHPRVAASAHPGVARAHRKIMSLMKAANARDPSAGHMARTDGKLTEGAEVIDSTTVGGFGAAVASALADDSRRDDRLRTRKHYFGDLGPGDSSRRFEEAVAALIQERDHLLTGHKRVTTGDVDAHD